MKVKITFIVLKKDNNISPASDQHLKVYLDDDYLFPFKYISTKNEYETLKEISEHYLNVDFGWMKKELHDIGIKLKKSYERAIFKRGKSPVGW